MTGADTASSDPISPKSQLTHRTQSLRLQAAKADFPSIPYPRVPLRNVKRPTHCANFPVMKRYVDKRPTDKIVGKSKRPSNNMSKKKTIEVINLVSLKEL
ncbi:hypothetical protein PGT21_031294 [Puccinia graminis f. sp. tritici]|uniref:Uncharacterized protein n=1 Tax=Puccinia graminis f. sp. tritici TaxID=56615 RepID=A0A5B0QC24_PUCGR|nr:hypothetical protein PGT21_031294 [Puccinia graminis f. sp. tritici]KAA1139170.1 hypothetical protein PGTUg99_036954 [Puccinia graminis f. sp. tritici]